VPDQRTDTPACCQNHESEPTGPPKRKSDTSHRQHTTQRQAKASHRPVTNTRAKAATGRDKIPWSMGISAMKCQGWSVLWFAAGVAAVADGPVCWQIALPWLGILHQPEFSAHVLAASPADPPPRACPG
jgi:hypothetical protein